MKLVVSLSLLFGFAYMVHGQSEVVDPCGVYTEAREIKSTTPFDQVLERDDLAPDVKANVQMLRAKAIGKIYGKGIRKGDAAFLKIAQTGLADFDAAIAYNRAEGLDDSGLRIKRYLVFGELMEYPDIEIDKELQEAYYSSNEKGGIGVGIGFMSNTDFWIGGEATVFQYQQSDEVQKDKIGNVIYRDNMFFVGSALSVGYYRNRSGPDESLLTFDLLSMKAPVVLRPTQFANLYTDEGSYFGYLPSVGYGNWGFNISYSYLVLFTKDVAFDNRHFLKLEYSYTFNRKKKTKS